MKKILKGVFKLLLVIIQVSAQLIALLAEGTAKLAEAFSKKL